MEEPRPLRRVVVAVVVAANLSIAARTQGDALVVQGRAIDRDGKPMAGCAVGVFERGERFDTRALLAAPTTTTDADGRYRIAAPEDRHRGVAVVVVAPGHQVCVQTAATVVVPRTHLRDALMLPGATLRGRVRDEAGKPIAGALVRVEDPLTANRYPDMWFESHATSDEKGIFEVPGVPRTGLRVTVGAEGRPAISLLAAHDSPLDLTLAATGTLKGTVVDADGKPMPGLEVNTVTVERQDVVGRVRTDAAGRFVLTVPRAARFRIAASESKPPHRRFSSGLLRGPADDVVVTSHGVAPTPRRVTVRCIDAATKAPVEAFHASRHSQPDFGALVFLCHQRWRSAWRGEAVFELGPREHGVANGNVVVDAPGHGFAVVKIPDDLREPLVAALPAECFLAGTVVDAETGAPAVGAAVRAMPQSDAFSGGAGGFLPEPWESGAVTDAKGRYRLGGLAPGEYDVQVYGRGRPAARSRSVVVASDREAALDLEVPKARYLEFELAGDVPAGCVGTITWTSSFLWSSMDGSMIEASLPPPPPLPVVGPRARKLGPIGNGSFQAQLVLPTRDRVGSCLRMDLGQVDGDGPVTLPDLRQFLHAGRVELAPDVPPERVGVLAHRAGGRRDSLLDLNAPFANCLGSDGSFVLDLPPGTYSLQLVDLETGLVFHTEAEDRELGAGTVGKPIVVRPTYRWLDIALEPTVAGGEVVCQCLAIDVELPRGGALPAALNASGSGKQTMTVHRSIGVGETRMRWLVGAGAVEVHAMQTFQALSPTCSGWQARTVDSAAVAPGERRATLRLPPPPDDAAILAGDK